MGVSSNDVFNGIIVPAVVAVLTALVGFFFKNLAQQVQKKNQDRKLQLERAQHIHDMVVGKMDELFSVMKNQAIYIAFIKAKENKIKPNDVDKWKRYCELLLEWKKNDVSYGAQVESYFCKTKDWTELKNSKELFDDINEGFKATSARLWQLYHAHSDEQFIGLDDKTFKPSYQDVDKDFLENQLHFSEFNEIEASLLAMSQHMTARIQDGNVGDLNAKKCCWGFSS